MDELKICDVGQLIEQMCKLQERLAAKINEHSQQEIWLSKKEVCLLFGITGTRLMHLAKAGKVNSKTRPGRSHPVYEAWSIAAFLVRDPRRERAKSYPFAEMNI